METLARLQLSQHQIYTTQKKTANEVIFYGMLPNGTVPLNVA